MARNVFNKKISDIADLIVADLKGVISQDDKAKLDEWLSEDKENAALLRSLKGNADAQKDADFFSSLDMQNSLEKIKYLTGQTPTPILTRYSKIIKIACLIVMITSAAGLYQYVEKGQKSIFSTSLTQAKKVSTVITPGGNKAKLELANGSLVVLEEYSGPAIHDKGVRIDRQRGVIVYSFPDEMRTDLVSYNRISTPKGGKFKIVLPDGSRVWLNSESSLRFPINLPDKERLVELTGEAYFEVAKMADKPFKVHVKDVTIEALGTSFNVMSYQNESVVKTTLVEGSIKVSKGKFSKMVVPGQQIEVKEAMKIVDNSNVLRAVAWKADLFEFENDELRTIFPQLERWYNVKIAYTEEIAVKRFTGTISRNTDIMVLLEMLKEAGIAYQLQERRIFFY